MDYPMTHKPYSKYKEAGVKWIGKVPEHWKVKRLKHIADVRLSNVDKHTIEGQKVVRLCNYLDVYNNRRITSGIDFMSATASDEQIERLSLQKDDVIITKDSEDPSDIAIPALVEEDIFGLVCGYHLAILRPTASNGEYLHYLLQSTFVRSAFEIEATGMTRYALGKYSIENLTFALPHQSEQTSIASFLDRETSRIDTLISEKERLISLLQEYRQALISHFVTKGLDPKVKMKDSGVEWLGEVPEHWEVLQGGRLFSQQRQPAFPNDKQLAATQKYGVVPQDLFMELEDQKVTLALNGINNFKHVEKDDFVISLRSFQGGIEWSKYIGCVSPAYTVLRSKQLIEAKYWAFVMKSNGFIATLQTVSDGIRDGKNISYDQFSIINFPLPPFSEQSSIASFLDRETSRIDTLISEARKFIDLLKEYRSSLITAAVIGKIDVREVVPLGPEKQEIAHE